MEPILEVVGGTAQSQPQAKKYFASIFPVGEPVSPEFGALIIELEKALGRKLWLLVQQGGDDAKWGQISETVSHGFRDNRDEIRQDAKIGLLIHSPGGHASCAYEIARLFQRRTKDFITVVPQYAKSAATLMALGGSKIIMGMDAELGPLDVQMYDRDNEEWDSALNAVQSLERLNAFALSAFDQFMFLLLSRVKKKADVLLPIAMEFATRLVQPLVTNTDAVDVTRKSRELKVAEDYAVRLMRSQYSPEARERIASSLVTRYSTHSFNIDRAEAGTEGASEGSPINLGLHLIEPGDAVEALFSRLIPHLERMTVIGTIREQENEQNATA